MNSIEDAITYVVGDATNPEVKGLKILAHIVNSSGGWGAGYVIPLGKRYPYAEKSYRLWAKGTTQLSFLHEQGEFALGETQFVVVEPNVMVANMCAQDGYARPERPIPVDYPSLKQCMQTVLWQAHTLKASICIPRIGCGLGGGSWGEVLDTIWDALVDNVSAFQCPDIFVYDLP